MRSSQPGHIWIFCIISVPLRPEFEGICDATEPTEASIQRHIPVSLPAASPAVSVFTLTRTTTGWSCCANRRCQLIGPCVAVRRRSTKRRQKRTSSASSTPRTAQPPSHRTPIFPSIWRWIPADKGRAGTRMRRWASWTRSCRRSWPVRRCLVISRSRSSFD